MRKTEFFYLPQFLMLVVLFMFGTNSFSQNRITGIVKDNVGTILQGAVVVIKNENSNAILNYGTTNSEGNFSITVDDKSLNLVISASYLGYKTFNKNITNTTQTIVIELEESLEELKEVVILKTDPVRQRGDTIVYAVSVFKNQSDRTIANVIEKMPGMGMLPTGQITYMGKPIEKYYIEGLDLLEGKYKLANESISADDVISVEIMENHQPIKVLDSLSGSDRTSINIRLKNNVSLSGKVEVGAGHSPALLKTAITPLMLSKKRQFFGSYQYNNTGEDLASNNKSFSSSNSQLPEFNASKKDLLDVQQLRKPPFSSERWLDNSDHYGTVNYLERLKKGLDLKVNLAYLNGTRQESGSQISTYLYASDTLSYYENIKNTYHLHSLDSKIILEKNARKNYFKNELSSQAYWDSGQGLINNNTATITQRLSTPFWNLKNHFDVLMPIGKQLIEFDSKLGYVSTAQELGVAPGPYIDFFNNGEEYGELRQFVKSNTFYTDNTIGLAKKLGMITIAPAIGFSFRNQKFQSTTATSTDNASPETSNDYSLKNSTVYISNKLEFKDKIWRISLQTPLFVRSFKLAEYNINSSPLTFEPRVSVSKKLTPFWETQITGQISNSFGDAQNLHNAFVLKNYRSLMRYDPILSKQTQYSTSARIRYRNVLKAVFGSLSASMVKNESNLMLDYQVSPEGGLTIMSIERGNDQMQKNISFTLSKYVENWKTTLSWSGSYYVMEQDQIVNETFVRYKTQGQQYGFKADVDAKKWLSLTIKSMFSTSHLFSKDLNFKAVKHWNNSMATFFYIDKKQSVSGDMENYYNNLQSNKNAVFLNMQYRYSFKKQPLDLSLSWNNILNTKKYVNNQNSQYYSLHSQYEIRPSQVLLTALFTL